MVHGFALLAAVTSLHRAFVYAESQQIAIKSAEELYLDSKLQGAIRYLNNDGCLPVLAGGSDESIVLTFRMDR